MQVCEWALTVAVSRCLDWSGLAGMTPTFFPASHNPVSRLPVRHKPADKSFPQHTPLHLRM